MNVEKFSLALADPLTTSTGTIERREGFLLGVEHRGRTGVGEASPLPGWTESVGECEAILADAAETVESDGVEAALRELPRSATAARHGLSTALLDADASAEAQSLAAWLADGDDPSGTLPVNATIGDADPAATAARAEESVADGFGCCKLKVGVRPVAEDLERVAAVRSTVGDAVALRVDANGAWTREEAENAIDGLAEYDVSLVEQPIDRDDLAGHATLRGGPVDVALDESLVSHSPAAIVDAGAADALILKPMVLGGPGEAHTLATWARERGLDVVVTTTVDAVVARTAAVHVAAAIPDVPACGLATADLLATDLGPDPAPVTDGEIAVPEAPGLGLSEVAVDD